MSEHFENRKNEVALRRFAAVSFIEQKVREGFGVVQALRLAALRPWPDENGRYSSARTWKITGMPGKAAGLPPSNPKAVVMRAFFASCRTKLVNGS
jgi:hypothetical protein